MKTKNARIKSFCLFVILHVGGVVFSQSFSPGPYLGQKPPGMVPEIFAPGIISTSDMENNIVFPADGKEILIERTSTGKSVLFMYKETADGWKGPIETEFSDEGGKSHPTFNKYLGVLLTQGGGSLADQIHPEIWLRERIRDKWNPAKLIGRGMQGSLSDSGVIYTTIIDFAGKFFGHIVRYVPAREGYSGPEYLPEAINNPLFASELPMIAPDESYIIFTTRRTETGPYGRLFISYRNQDHNWRTPENLSAVLNTPVQGHEWLATLSPDKKYLFYNVSGDIYWVDARIIEFCKPK